MVTGHHVIVRENTVAGLVFQIGTLSEIQGDCSIGDYVRFQSNIFVGKNDHRKFHKNYALRHSDQ
jgi:UDP-3-O-[3-hydroxymyristoyl] glucosamine N-acyltransferase